MQASLHTRKIEEICNLAPVIPVLVIENSAHAASLARALRDGGLPALEITLRTDCALDAIAEMSQVEGVVVGAGTVITPRDAALAHAAGAQFAVSPGNTPALVGACRTLDLPLLPGAVTATEAMINLEHGYEIQKFFPAEASGGAPALKALNGPLPQIRFCPTGGVTPENAASYLSLPNTLCVGGSWVAPTSLIASEAWEDITRIAKQAAATGS